jgi:ankyrin repeat protein
MKYIKLFEEHNYSVYDLITMDVNQVFDLLKREMSKGNPDLELIKDILAYTVVDINSKDSNGWTALMLAADWGKSKSVELLLNHPGIDVNVQTENGTTALMWVAYNENEKVVELLLNHPGIDVNMQDRWGWTAWDHASGYIRQQFPQLNPDFIR